MAQLRAVRIAFFALSFVILMSVVEDHTTDKRSVSTIFAAAQAQTIGASGAPIDPVSGLTDPVIVNSSAQAPEMHEYLAGSPLVEFYSAGRSEMHDDNEYTTLFTTTSHFHLPFQNYDPKKGMRRRT